jgi:hypothetical protein
LGSPHVSCCDRLVPTAFSAPGAADAAVPCPTPAPWGASNAGMMQTTYAAVGCALDGVSVTLPPAAGSGILAAPISSGPRGEADMLTRAERTRPAGPRKSGRGAP